ncbi:MAG: DUF502 domain-containing protein [Chlamydiota bacterium]
MKKQVIAGLILLIPLTLTIVILLFMIRLFTSPFLALFTQSFEHLFPTHTSHALLIILSYAASLLFLFILIYLLGVFAQWFFFKTLLNKAHHLFIKIPLIKSIFHVSRDLVKVFLSNKTASGFSHPVLIPFSTLDNYVLGLALKRNHPKIERLIPHAITTVFFPTSPHPISGFLAFVPKHLVKKVEKNNEEAIKFIISCGILSESHE